jgi:WD40 repeat protein
MIDISHESLIRGWGRLHQWVEEEAQSARVYRRLGEQAELYRDGKAGLFDELDVKLAVEWREQWKPEQAWATRYRYDFADAMRFLKTCERKVAKEINRLRIVAGIFCALFLLAGGLLLYTLRAKTLLEFYKYKDYHHLASSALDEAGKNNFPKANSLLGSINLEESKDIRHFEWKYLWQSGHNEMATLALQPHIVPSVFFGAGGDRLAAADMSGNIVRWDVSKDPAQRLTTLQLKGDTAPIYAVTFSPDGKYVVTGHADGSLFIWEEDGKMVDKLSRFPEQANNAGPPELKVQPKPWDVSSIAFSHDGATLAAGHADGIVQVWDVRSRKATWYMEPCPSKEQGFCGRIGKAEKLATDDQQAARTAVGFSPDGKYIATGHARGMVLLWNSSGQIVKVVDPVRGQRDDAGSGALRDIFSIAFSPKSEALAAGRANGIIDVWPVAQSMSEPRRRLGGRLSNVSVAQEQSVAVRNGGDDKEGQKTDLGREAENKHSSAVTAIVFLDEGMVASGSLDGTVKLWNIRSQEGSEFVASKKGHSGGLLSLAYSPERNRLATGGDDKTVKLWDARASEPPSVLPESNSVQSVALPAKGGSLLATVDAEGKIALWNTNEGRKLESPRFEGAQPAEGNKITSAALSPDGALFASGWNNGTVKVWRTSTGELVKVLDPPPAGESASTVISLSFISDDGATLATVNSVGTVKVWGTETGKLLFEGSFNESQDRSAPRPYAAAFSPDGTTLAVGVMGEESEVKLLDVRTLKSKGTLKGSGGGKTFLSLAFSDDGRRLVGSLDRTVKMWPVNTTWTETIVNWLPDGLVWRLGIENQREPLILKTSAKSHIISVALNQRILAIAPASGGIELLRAAEDGKINEQQLKER